MPERAISPMEPQSAAAVLMVRPACFGFNAQTAPSNSFQRLPQAGAHSDLQALALGEFDALADGLRRAGVNVIVADDTPVPAKPDALFPNNWVSFHSDGTVVLYPMLAPHRGFELPRRIRQVSRGYRQFGARPGRACGIRKPVAAHRSRCARRICPTTRL